ncbi:MAG: DoxX family protein [Bacteroidales bacterium]|nr:DoxX family protein [Bacteroidales bacterium]
MNPKTVSILKLIARILMGGLFIFTAILKLISIDNFEVYIFSFNIFSYTMAGLIARAVIAAEFVLGALLIAKIFYKPTWWLTMAMLVGFTFLLVYVALFRDDSNCHCFGELVELNPVASIAKNLVMVAVLLFIRKEEDYQFRFWKWVLGAILAVAIIVPFVVVPTDAIYTKLFRGSDTVFNEELFAHSLQDSSFMVTLTNVHRVPQTDSVTFDKLNLPLELSSGKFLVACFSASCPHCRLSMQKINTIWNRKNIDAQHFKILMWGSDQSVSRFIKDTKSDVYETRIISPIVAIDLVEGVFPTFLLFDRGKFIKTFDFRTLDESQLEDFFSEKSQSEND